MIIQPWLKECKRLAVGQSARFRCCGTDKAGVLYNNVDAWEYYCHRCKGYGKERKQFVQQVSAVPERTVQPAPADAKRVISASPEVQNHIYSFLVNKGIMPEMVGDILWSQTSNRILFPLQSGISLGRALDSRQNPKWIQYGGRSSFAMAPVLSKSTDKSLMGVVLTEDYLSALKVAHVSNHYGNGDLVVIALLGTRLDSKLKLWIAERGLPVLLMLDGDDAGYEGTKRITQSLRLYTSVRAYAKDGYDPKDLTVQEIIDAIK